MAGDRLLGLRERGVDSWVTSSYLALGPSSTWGPWLRWPGMVPDPTAPVQPFLCPSSQHWVGDRKRQEETRQEERGGGVL